MDIERSLVEEIRAMREQLIRMDERMNMVQDHETRLRVIESPTYELSNRITALEKWRYALPTSMVLGLGGSVGALLQFIASK